MINQLKQFEGFNITFNTNEDCNLACKYDILEGTNVLMADLTEKTVEKVKKGDIVLGFNEDWSHDGIKYIRYGVVEDCGFTRMVGYAYKYKTENHELYATGEHPVLNQDDVFQTTEEFYESKNEHKEVYVSLASSEDKNAFKKADVSIEKVYFKSPKKAYNITTTSRTFIANRIFVHNCYEIEKKHRVLSLDYAKKFIDLILTDPDPIGCVGTNDEWILDRGLILDFIGGDSFMHVDLIDKILSYFIYKVNTVLPNHKWSNNWRASISSNGTLFEKKECRDFILKWGKVLSLGISIDGCPTIHDKNRIFAERGPNGEEVGSMSTIIKWWPWLKENHPSTCTRTKATCSRDSIPYLYESLKFMHEELGMIYINQNFIMEDTGCTEEDYELLRKEMDKCVEYVLEHRDKLYWSMIDKRYLRRSQDLDKGWCGSGAMPALSINGKIYPCFRWLPHTQDHGNGSKDDYCVGDVWKGFDRKNNFRKIREATRRTISPPECLECEYEANCSFCIAGCYSEFGCFKRTTHICEITKILTKASIKYWKAYDDLEGTDSLSEKQ